MKNSAAGSSGASSRKPDGPRVEQRDARILRVVALEVVARERLACRFARAGGRAVRSCGGIRRRRARRAAAAAAARPGRGEERQQRPQMTRGVGRRREAARSRARSTPLRLVGGLRPPDQPTSALRVDRGIEREVADPQLQFAAARRRARTARAPARRRAAAHQAAQGDAVDLQRDLGRLDGAPMPRAERGVRDRRRDRELFVHQRTPRRAQRQDSRGPQHVGRASRPRRRRAGGAAADRRPPSAPGATARPARDRRAPRRRAAELEPEALARETSATGWRRSRSGRRC